VHGAEDFVDAVVRGSARDAVALLAPDVTIADPREGTIAGAVDAQRWVRDAHAWLSTLSARAEPIRVTAAGRAAVVERLLRITVDGEERQLPLAVAAEADDAGLRAIRLYHSFWPLEREHRVRGRLLPPRAGVALLPPLDAYERALARGDVDGVLACYGPRATVREPAGEPFLHRGPRGLRRLYGAMLMNGGIPLEYGGVIDDGSACAVEYTVVRWGRTELPPQAGVAVYERGAGGLLRAARIYDDVDPPRD
jgi:ketosteroid isomerase-like protein